MTKPRPGASRSNAGRPTVFTPELVNKLEEAFSIGCSDIEACLFAGISKQALYNYQDRFPEFVDRKEMLKERPVLKARSTVIKNLGEDDTARWYLERKKKNEFSIRNELTGADGSALTLAELVKKNAL